KAAAKVLWGSPILLPRAIALLANFLDILLLLNALARRQGISFAASATNFFPCFDIPTII
ncbi:MAG: hypothetical protein ACKPA7_07350, partial [Sphaerospermopsis kisseleviana]